MTQQKFFGITIGKKDGGTADGVAKPKASKPNLLSMSPQEAVAFFKGRKNRSASAPVDVEKLSFNPDAPGVNLLPGAVAESYAAGALAKKFFVAAAVVALAFILVGVGSFLGASSHRDNMAQLQQDQSTLQSQITTMQPYDNYLSNIDSKRSTLSKQMNKEFRNGQISKAMFAAADKAGISLSSVTFDGSSTGACTNPDPFNKTTALACISFSGNYTGQSNLLNFIAALKGTEGFSSPSIPNTGAASGAGEASMSGTVAVDSKLYSNEWAKLGVPLRGDNGQQ